MKSTFFATAALVAAATADSIGSAIVINKCNYDVYMFNTPSADGGYTEIDKVLSTDDSYTQKYTQLTNGNGWSIKLSNSTDLADILQYEYTFHDDGIIWYDLSAVNGNPWDGNWEISADVATCVPRQAAYRYATDDAYGMQSCSDDATITVTLCSGESQNDGAASSISSSVAAATSTAESTYVAPSTASTPTSVSAVVSVTPVPSTTLQTSVITSAPTTSGGDDVIVTVTKVATTTYWSHKWGPPSKRDAHQHHHAARHPHARD